MWLIPMVYLVARQWVLLNSQKGSILEEIIALYQFIILEMTIHDLIHSLEKPEKRPNRSEMVGFDRFYLMFSSI